MFKDFQFTVGLFEPDAQKRGDMFTRLMSPMFTTLGYVGFSYDVHKSGREIDIQGRHRTENRRLVVECKATARPVGGDVVNTFVGTLSAEREGDANKAAKDTPVTGYFVSLSGFTGEARQQEADAGDRRVVLMDGQDIVHQLVLGGGLVHPAAATDRAGRLLGDHPALTLDRQLLLIGHEVGWLWAVFYGSGHQRSHFALIHADGELLADSVAAHVRAADADYQQILKELTYLAPPDMNSEAAAASSEYFRYLDAACGHIYLDGLPLDGQLKTQFPLEDLFVPLQLKRNPTIRLIDLKWPPPRPRKTGYGWASRILWTPVFSAQSFDNLISLGTALTEHPHMAILGPPGSGKSTMLKRLATAYVSPTRRALVDDSLPSDEFVPFLIRCRELGDRASMPLQAILEELHQMIALRATTRGFASVVRNALHAGTALLLIDGLDEIADAGKRRIFAEHVQVFMTMYPRVRVVLTSREPGFRDIAGLFSENCPQYHVAPLDNRDIERLVIAWHASVYGADPGTARDAAELAVTICRLDRVRALATNPLLLTTLLLVHRWLRQLPNKRSVLYGRAIDVLLMTWNVQAHAPLDLEEAIPQLAYIAFAMMKSGEQRISQRKLRTLIQEAREQLPEILGRTTQTPADFLRRVELRSSLLIEAGHIEEAGTLMPVYEFRHLTIQEYLAAKAVAERYVPNTGPDDTAGSILKPYLAKDTWKEVIPLAAVLASRHDAPTIIQELIAELDRCAGSAKTSHIVEALCQCVLDEVRVPPALLDDALGALARNALHVTSGIALGASRDGARFRESLRKEARRPDPDITAILRLLGYTIADVDGLLINPMAKHIRARLDERQPDAIIDACALLVLLDSLTLLDVIPEEATKLLAAFQDATRQAIPGEIRALLVSWRLLAGTRWFTEDATRWLLPWLVRTWCLSPVSEALRSDCSKVVVALPLLSLPVALDFDDGERDRIGHLLREWTVGKDDIRAMAALVVSYYLGDVWSNSELREHLHYVGDTLRIPASPEKRTSIGDRLIAALPETALPPDVSLPCAPMRDAVLYPGATSDLTLEGSLSVGAVYRALAQDNRIVLVQQKDPDIDTPAIDDLYHIGTLGEIGQVVQELDSSVRIVVRGIEPVNVTRFIRSAPTFRVTVETFETTSGDDESVALNALRRDYFEWLTSEIPDADMLEALTWNSDEQAAAVTDTLKPSPSERQALLEADRVTRLRMLSAMLKAKTLTEGERK